MSPLSMTTACRPHCHIIVVPNNCTPPHHHVTVNHMSSTPPHHHRPYVIHAAMSLSTQQPHAVHTVHTATSTLTTTPAAHATSPPTSPTIPWLPLPSSRDVGATSSPFPILPRLDRWGGGKGRGDEEDRRGDDNEGTAKRHEPHTLLHSSTSI